MWSIHNTIQQSQKLSDHKRFEKTQNLVQSYVWKHGTVYLSTHQQPTDLSVIKNSSVVITTEPFYNIIKSDPQYQSLRQRVIFVEPGQQNKTLDTVHYVCESMLKLGINRQSTVYILGGGMVLDLGGFVSAIYMRGVKKVVYIPTTLLAVVDATVGGKNGVNWSGAKNMIGVVRHPHQIRISLHYLDSLSDRQFSNGLAEVIKMSITHDRQLFEFLESQDISLSKLRNHKQLLRKMIKKSLQIKIKVVQRDQFDRGQRNWLNFGHTVGHAIELSNIGSKLMHGQCVSVGMIQQIKIGFKNGQIKDKNILKRIQNILKKYNLPTKIPSGIESSQLIKLMTKDKKNKELTNIQFTLIQEIGKRKLETTPIQIQKLYEHFTNQVIIKLNKQKNLLKLQTANKDWKQNNKFPSSKSLSIRYLFLAALHYYKNRKSIVINNFLFADDSECIRQCLVALGFQIRYQSQQKIIQIYGYQPTNSGTLNVGNSGLTARFILPLCSHLQGQWTIQCHPRMSERPNKQIFKFCLENYNIQVEYLSGQNNFPAKIISKGLKTQSMNKKITINSEDSSQFLSSILLNSYIWMNRMQVIIPTEKLVSESYVKMTIGCLQYFGSVLNHTRVTNVGNVINIDNTAHKQLSQVITIEQDLSSFSYPYALSLIHSSDLPQLPARSSQGDIKFYQYCHQLLNSSLPAQLQFSQCTDTFMTFAVILATNTNNRFNIKHDYIEITGISNQRIKQSNRIKLTRDNLAKIGYYIEQTQDGLIFPIQSHQYMYKRFKNKQNVIFQTAGDHRLAMSMAVLATYLSSHQNISQKGVTFIIDDKNAVNKTFPSFWDYLKDSGINLNYKLQLIEQQAKILNKVEQKKPKIKQKGQKVNKIVLLGNRGCGKSTIGKLISEQNNKYLIDIDEQIKKQISQKYPNNINNIKQFVQCYGWDKFRKLESDMVDKFVSSSYLDHIHNNSASKQISYVVSVGGGVVDSQNSISLLGKENRKHLNMYIQKQFNELQIQINQDRPFIDNFEQVYQIRSKKYEQIADYIVTIPKMSNKQGKQSKYKLVNQYFRSEFNRLLRVLRGDHMKEGIVYCVPRIYEQSHYGQTIDWTNQPQFFKSQILQNDDIENDIMTGIELRIDSIIQHSAESSSQLNSFDRLIKQCRYSVADFKYTNNEVVRNIPILLTLRTKDQFGLFPFQKQQNNYHKWVNALHKIPAEYIDYEYKQVIQNRKNADIQKFIHDFPKYVYSYHGSSISTINSLLSHKNEIEANKSLIKLCYKGSNNMWDAYHKKWQQSTDICINLQNPLTRVSDKNRYKMVIRQKDKSGVIKIPTRRQLLALSSVKKLLLRH